MSTILKQYIFNHTQEEGENDNELNIIYSKTHATLGEWKVKPKAGIIYRFTQNWDEMMELDLS